MTCTLMSLIDLWFLFEDDGYHWTLPRCRVNWFFAGFGVVVTGGGGGPLCGCDFRAEFVLMFISVFCVRPL